MSVDVSVVICTWNRAGLLDQTLARMRELRAPAGLVWELIVVNNNCSDHTDEIAKKHSSALPLRLVNEPTPGKVHAANRAFGEARGDLILWTDDDVLVDPDWLGAFAAGAARHPDAAGFGGPIDPWFPADPDPVLLAAFPPLRMGFCGLDIGPDERTMAADEYGYGANMGFRAAAVRGIRFNKSLGRFKDFMGGHEDKDYQDRVRAAGGRIVWLPGMRVRHYVDPARMTARHMADYYYGVGASDVRRDGVPVGPRLLGAPRYLYRVAAERYAQYLLAKLRRDRRAELEHLRSYSYHRGLIRGCRDRAGATR
jgi:glycosyltransferase involved in cell wall biosynthesis